MPIKSNGNGDFTLSNGSLQAHLEGHTGEEGSKALDMFLGFNDGDISGFVDYLMENDRQLHGSRRYFVYGVVEHSLDHVRSEYGRV
tara:strand:+ start:681 stop:938 length:258 start_codon:yes stop_codon:yes gene_type:complete